MGKNQKKKGQTMSLAEFASDTVAADPMALPTAPRESTHVPHTESILKPLSGTLKQCTSLGGRGG